MEVSEDVMSEVVKTADLKYTLHIDDKTFILQNVSIEKAKIPVRKPTTRGGVYFTDTMAYKIKASTNDLSILALLPKLMLGPNTEFQPVEVRISLPSGNEKRNVTLVSHVSNTVNTANRVDLNMIVDGTI